MRSALATGYGLVPKALYFSAPSGGAGPVLVANFTGQTLTVNVRFGPEAVIPSGSARHVCFAPKVDIPDNPSNSARLEGRAVAKLKD